uniref:TTK protein kinase n=1 Tax=Aotus nancymaae TaxID=37293 RepID=A0A2K5E894_AOTNA
MESEDLSGRELTIDSIMNKVRDIKNKFKNEDLTDELSLNKISADTTGDTNHFIFNLPMCFLSFSSTRITLNGLWHMITLELLTKL